MESIPKTEDDSFHSEHDSTTEQFQDERSQAVNPTIGAKENKRVIYSRILVGVVLIVCAGLTSSLAYVVTDREEHKSFESEVRRRALLVKAIYVNTAESLDTPSL